MTNRKIFSLTAAGALLLALLTGGHFLYYIFLTQVVIYIGSYFLVRWNSKNLYMFFNISNDVVTAGDAVRVEYKISNLSFVPIAYALMTFKVSKRLGDMALQSEAAYFGPYQMITIKREVLCKNRGFFTIGKLLVHIRDPFGLFEEEVVFDKEIDLIVYPRVHPISAFDIPAKAFFGNVNVPLVTHEDFTSLKAVRAYQTGDSLKKIHWKLSSKSSETYVKEFDLSADTKVYMLIDGHDESVHVQDASIQDGIAEISISLIRYLLSKEIEVGLVCSTEKRELVEGKTMEHYKPFLDAMTRYVPSGRQSFDGFIRMETSKLYFGSTIVACTHRVTEALLYTLIGLRDKKFDVILIVYNAGETTSQNHIQLLRSRGIRVLAVESREEISGALEVNRVYSAKPI